MSNAKYFLAALVISSGLAIAGCSAEGKTVSSDREAGGAVTNSTALRPVAVEVFNVKSSLPVSEQLIPAVVSIESAIAVMAKRDGLIVWIAGKEGAPVAKGQIVARLDDDDSRAQLRQAELEVIRLKIEERQNEAQVEVNRTELERQRALWKDGLVSERELDQAKYKFEVCKQELEKARLGTRIAQSRVEAAQMEIEKANITAPLGGVITRVYVKQAGSVTRGDKLLEISGLAPLEARFQLRRNETDRIAPGSIYAISLAQSDVSVAQARILRCDPAADSASDSLDYLAEIIGGAGLAPGATVYVHVPSFNSTSIVWIPRAAFPAEASISAGALSTIFTVNEGKCAPRMVLLRAITGDQVGVVSGLAMNDQIILAPPPELRAGDPVEVAGHDLKP